MTQTINFDQRLCKFLVSCGMILVCGCTKDYNPLSELEDTPSTLSREEEIELIDRGEDLLKELDVQDLEGMQRSSKSIADLRHEKQAKAAANVFVPDELPTTAWIDSAKLPIDQWEVYYRKSDPVGFVHRTVRSSLAAGENRIVIDVESIMYQQSANAGSITVSDFMIVESTNGGLKSIDGKTQVESKRTSINVVAASDIVRVTSASGQVKNLKRDLRLRGPLAVDESLRHKMMQVGEVRKLQVFDPATESIRNLTLNAKGLARVPVLSGEYQELMEIEQHVLEGDQILASTLWCDTSGIVQKRFLGVGGVSSFAATSEIALSIRSGLMLRNLKKRSIPLAGKIDPDSTSNSILFRVTSSAVDPFQLVRGNFFQVVNSVSPIACDVEVRRKDIDTLLQVPASDSLAGAEFLKASRYIDHDHASIKDLLSKLVDSSSSDPVALQIAKGLNRQLKLTEPVFKAIPASQLATAMEADVFGAATLMTALCRAANIPSRVATGLVYRDSSAESKMAYHAWAEIQHNGQWLPIDCTQPDGKLFPITIWISDSAMSDENPLQPVVAAFEAIENLEISVR